jgi:nucleotide-binding universal stress UspA family protein
MTIFPTKILLVTDGSEDAKLAAHTAADLAQKTGSELYVACVGLLPRIDPYNDLISPSYRFETERHADKEVEQFLHEQVKQIDAGLIVLGSRGQGGIRRALMGSVSDSVVRHAHCPVLIVRKDERDEV